MLPISKKSGNWMVGIRVGQIYRKYEYEVTTRLGRHHQIGVLCQWTSTQQEGSLKML